MSESDYFIGVDFGTYSTRCSVLLNQNDNLHILDMREIPLAKQCDNLFERYNAGISDVAEYLKTKKIVVKSIVSNLRGQYIRSAKTSVSKSSKKPVNKIKKSLVNISQRKLSKIQTRQDEQVVKSYIGNFSILNDKELDITKPHKDVKVDSISIYSNTSDCVELMKASMDNGIYIEDIIPTNLSSSYLIEKCKLQSDEFFIFLDIGHQSTEVSMLNQNIVLSVDNYPFGGDDITTMIMEEFKINFDQAENLKLSWSDDYSDLPFGKNKQEVRFAKRLRDELFVLFQMIKKNYIGDGLNPGKLKSVLFSGGVSQQFGLVEIASEFHNKPCYSIGQGPFKYFLNNHIKPEMSCALGLSYISYMKRTSRGNHSGLKTTMQNYFSSLVERILFTD
ncbi:MAG: hypothetical protein COA79_03690 [Planctomycetota bacterium]|nr:MAG: hypothetical protein COA79_03690 [Planctomycetota bacterium]